jgi:anti-anti-sigma regulatory factor
MLFSCCKTGSTTSNDPHTNRTTTTIGTEDSQQQTSCGQGAEFGNRPSDFANAATSVDADPKAVERGDTRTIVLDCTRVNNIDFMGVNALKKAWTAYKSVGIDLTIAGCRKEVEQKLKASGLVDGGTQRGNESVTNVSATMMKLYPTVHDAVIMSLCEL